MVNDVLTSWPLTVWFTEVVMSNSRFGLVQYPGHTFKFGVVRALFVAGTCFMAAVSSAHLRRADLLFLHSCAVTTLPCKKASQTVVELKLGARSVLVLA